MVTADVYTGVRLVRLLPSALSFYGDRNFIVYIFFLASGLACDRAKRRVGKNAGLGCSI